MADDDKEESKRENLAQLNEVISLFKESIDKVFDRVSAFTFEKYKEENDDERTMIEENYKEERYTERVNQGGVWGSFKRKFLSWADDDAGYDEEKDYENLLNNEKLQKKLREWRRSKRQ